MRMRTHSARTVLAEPLSCTAWAQGSGSLAIVHALAIIHAHSLSQAPRHPHRASWRVHRSPIASQSCRRAATQVMEVKLVDSTCEEVVVACQPPSDECYKGTYCYRLRLLVQASWILNKLSRDPEWTEFEHSADSGGESGGVQHVLRCNEEKQDFQLGTEYKVEVQVKRCDTDQVANPYALTCDWGESIRSEPFKTAAAKHEQLPKDFLALIEYDAHGTPATYRTRVDGSQEVTVKWSAQDGMEYQLRYWMDSSFVNTPLFGDPKETAQPTAQGELVINEIAKEKVRGFSPNPATWTTWVTGESSSRNDGDRIPFKCGDKIRVQIRHRGAQDAGGWDSGAASNWSPALGPPYDRNAPNKHAEHKVGS